MRAGSAAVRAETQSESLSRAAAPSPPHEEESSSRANLVCGVTSDVQRQKQMGLHIPVRLFKIELGQRRVIGPWAGNQHVVDRSGQFVEELREAVKVGSIKGHSALRVEFARYLLKALGIPASEDQLGPLSACSSGRFQPNASAAADYNDSLPKEFRFAPDGNGGCCGAHDSSRNLRSRASTARREGCGPGVIVYCGKSLPDCSATM